MAHEPRYEQFEVTGPDGHTKAVRFRKAGFLTAGDQPEVFFFEVGGEEVVVGVSGSALRELQGRWRYLSREEKIDLAGLFLKRQTEAGKSLTAENLFLRDEELASILRELGLGA